MQQSGIFVGVQSLTNRAVDYRTLLAPRMRGAASFGPEIAGRRSCRFENAAQMTLIGKSGLGCDLRQRPVPMYQLLSSARHPQSTETCARADPVLTEKAA